MATDGEGDAREDGENRQVCHHCGKPLSRVPSSYASPPFFCDAIVKYGRQTGCYVQWWAKMVLKVWMKG